MAGRFKPSSPATIKDPLPRRGSWRCARRALSAAVQSIVQRIRLLRRQPRLRPGARSLMISCTISPRAPPVAPLSKYPTAARISALASSGPANSQSSCRLHADALADDGAARNLRCHARNLGHDGHLGESLRGYRTSERRRSGYLPPASDISAFLDGRAESRSVVTKTPRSASSASSRSNFLVGLRKR
jgi:hypothetical protein